MVFYMVLLVVIKKSGKKSGSLQYQIACPLIPNSMSADTK
ncbi:hypothetical protein DESAMIL20_665 [Desulfurella amilsii]|uniref:Uncharacterized protein n=1 Tax=Desulfurella amilsii TaxID=1562698 RepID=A0A1X4XY63_9BACT|nr:hypothetical protein DESAMIL20_665 [Desulfurella amilsii]